MSRELVFDGMLYLRMEKDETKEDAIKRLQTLLESAGICVGDYETEERTCF